MRRHYVTDTKRKGVVNVRDIHMHNSQFTMQGMIINAEATNAYGSLL